jgi:hypothetical protein
MTNASESIPRPNTDAMSMSRANPTTRLSSVNPPTENNERSIRG